LIPIAIPKLSVDCCDPIRYGIFRTFDFAVLRLDSGFVYEDYHGEWVDLSVPPQPPKEVSPPSGAAAAG
jgi:hypothetical protein